MSKICHRSQLLFAISFLLEKAGSSREEAFAVAENLIDADASGHPSHGLVQLPGYLASLEKGDLHPNRHAQVIRSSPPFLVIDGNRGYGQVIFKESVEMALTRAKVQGGFSVLAVRNTNHIGRVGTYGALVAQAGFVGIFFVNVMSVPVVAPFNGIEPRMGTNPICIAIPRTPDHQAVILDFATSAISSSKCRGAVNNGEHVEPGMLIDAEGNATTDPSVLYSHPSGSILPFGGHKGFGLGLACELLAGAIAGEEIGATQEKSIRNNILAFLFDPEKIASENWRNVAADILDYIEETPSAKGRVSIPGSPENAFRALSEVKGIAIDLYTLQSLDNIAQKLGFDLLAMLED